MRARLGWALGLGFLLPACGESPLAPSVGTLTVNGIVVDEYRRPQPHLSVFVPGQVRAAVTDADGRFTLGGVQIPYDLVIGLATERAALVYSGLSRHDPMVIVPASPYDAPFSAARVKGQVLPLAGAPAAGTRTTSVFFESRKGRWQGSVGNDGRYDVSPRWLGPATVEGKLHALRWRSDSLSGLPVGYEGYGSVPFTLHGGGDVEGPSITLVGPVGTGTVSGSVTVPTGFRLSSRALRAGFGAAPHGSPAGTVATESEPAAEFTYLVADLPDVTYTLFAEAGAGAARVEHVEELPGPGATGLVVDIPSPPTLVSPLDDASGPVHGTDFRWTGLDRGIHLPSLRYVGSAILIPPPPAYYVLTSGTVARIPDLSLIGLTPWVGAAYSWEVRAWAQFGSLDEITDAPWSMPPSGGTSAVSASRRFTPRR